MRKLISFLVSYFTLILFVLLQGIAFYLIYQSQPYQHSEMFALHAEWTGRTLETYNTVENYFHLGKTNAHLARENAALKSANKASYFSLVSMRDSILDTIYRQQYSYLEAKVINSSYTKRNNYITLNRGSIHGVKPDMAVVANDGAIGIVKDVTKHYCTVIPLIHSRSSLSVTFKNNPFFGPLSWDGKTYRFAQMTDIPREAPFDVGDTIVTGAQSLAFPAGIPIGTVARFEQNPEDLNYTINVALSTNFAALDYVYVIDNLLRSEREDLENQQEE
jgi:rod shape-determining protein MreC